jgi:hypothetical protein
VHAKCPPQLLDLITAMLRVSYLLLSCFVSSPEGQIREMYKNFALHGLITRGWWNLDTPRQCEDIKTMITMMIIIVLTRNLVLEVSSSEIFNTFFGAGFWSYASFISRRTVVTRCFRFHCIYSWNEVTASALQLQCNICACFCSL